MENIKGEVTTKGERNDILKDSISKMVKLFEKMSTSRLLAKIDIIFLKEQWHKFQIRIVNELIYQDDTGTEYVNSCK